MAEEKTSKQPWDRLDGEKERWYNRFLEYRNMGPGRTMIALYNAFRVKKGSKPAKSPSGSWTGQQQKFRWRERAEAWDAAQIKRIERRLQEKLEAEGEQWYENYVNALRAYYTKLTQRLQLLNPQEITPASLGGALIATGRELRDIYGLISKAGKAATSDSDGGGEGAPGTGMAPSGQPWNEVELAKVRREQSERLKRWMAERGLSVVEAAGSDNGRAAAVGAPAENDGPRVRRNGEAGNGTMPGSNGKT